MQKLLYCTIHMHYNYLCTHASTILMFLKSMVLSNCYCVHTAVSAGYSIILSYNNEIVFAVITCIRGTQLPHEMCII